MSKLVSLLQKFNPEIPENAGPTLLALNAGGMILAALSNTFAIAIDKNTKDDEKQFLIPAGLLTGLANIGTYFLVTKKFIDKFEGDATKAVKNMSPENLAKNATELAKKTIDKAQKGFLGTDLFKKSDKYVSAMKETLLKDGQATQSAKQLYQDKYVAGASVLGAFAGVVVSSGILTPIIRDVSANLVQKMMEEKNPSLKDMPYKPYFDPAHLKVSHNIGLQQNSQKIPLTMKSYMAFTNGTMKI